MELEKLRYHFLSYDGGLTSVAIAVLVSLRSLIFYEER